MRRNTALTLFLLLSLAGWSQTDSINQRVFLIGDAGDILANGDHPVVNWLERHVDWNDPRNTVVYLGDNIYPEGLPMEGEASYRVAKRIIDVQINLVKGKKARAYFVMGNHDWKAGKIGGWQQAMNQVNYINGQEQPNIVAQPTEGCPGPVLYELSDKVMLVMMDSQWFLHLHEKPGPGSNCASTSVEGFATELNEIVARYPNHLLILAMHHPMYSYGVHGGNYTWKEHLFPLTALNPKLWIPLPVLGSVYPVSRGVFGNVQDVKHPLYQTMKEAIEDVLKRHPNPIAVAGHDHNLQLITRDSLPFIVTGSGAKTQRVHQSGKQGDLLFSDPTYGFALLEVWKSGRVETRFYNVNSRDLSDPTFRHEMKNIDTAVAVVTRDSIPVLPDSVLVTANRKLYGNFGRRTFLGRNYRKEWTTPMRVEVLDLGKEGGGLTPEKQGGGKQTKSLRLVDKEGKDWALRSIEKFPEAAIPQDLRSPFARRVVEQGISASYPTASLSIAPLARAAGLPPIRRRLVYIPDDPRLGRFRPTFANTLAILEEREPVGVKKAYNTDELVLRLAKDNDDHVDQVAVLKARLLDNFIMDFDRHEDQWQWATRDTGKGKIYYPIPRDHDQAFYINQGLIPKFARKPWFAPQLQGFRADAKNIRTFNAAARNFDRFFLNELTWEQWSAHVDTLLQSMTDAVIDSAILRQPAELRNGNIRNIAETLRKRRQFYRDDMRQYYEFISREVTVVGSNQRELFRIHKNDSGHVRVTLHKIDKEGQISSRLYDRTFDPGVTKELRLFGLQDNDSFAITGTRSPIKIRIIGGPGNDDFYNEAKGGPTLVYDVTFEENEFHGSTAGLRRKVSPDPANNMYTRQFYKYDFVNPGVSVSYNVDDGLFLGYQLEVTKQGFRKEPYRWRQFLRVQHALGTSSYRFQYEGDYTRFIGHSDLLVRADVRAPINVTNFFGLGNETVWDKSRPGGIRYYRARYDLANASILLRRQLQSWMRVTYGGTFQYFNLEEEQNKDKFVSRTELNGLDPATLYLPKSYAGVHLGLDINSQNNRVVPTRGFVLDAHVRPMVGLNNSSHFVTQWKWDMRLFASFRQRAILVYAFRLGVGHTSGKFEFPQAQYLSGTQNLRGYRRDRFAGRTMLFNNSEIRLKLAEFNTFLFPGAVGLFVFNDVGRVWNDGEKSTDWHVGNGGGVWIAPIRRFVITAAATRSKEEKLLPYVTFGFQF
ncbi:MAG TPA: BamA/TamA family outer membrane protein [Chitinophagaceae bacterium]|nr:BamA/TamA family outer membrane protein [Chitinophagaceae bacterium]